MGIQWFKRSYRVCTRSCCMLDQRAPFRSYDKRFVSPRDAVKLREFWVPFSSTSTRRPLFTKDGAITVGEGVIGSSLHSRRNRPLFVRENPTSTKAYICTFTYACSRMTHLNLTSDLSTHKIFQALIRMISGR